MSVLLPIRDEVYTRILLKRTLEQFSINTFTLVKAWKPWQLLEDFSTDHPGGKVYIIGMAGDDAPNLSRGNLTVHEPGVMVGYQRPIADPNSVNELDPYVSFMEELRDCCRKDVTLAGYSWVRNESLKDAEGVPYSFVMLREALIFEAYFTAYYRTPVE